MQAPRKILVATDFSESAARALELAVELAVKLDAKLHLVHVLGVGYLGVAELGAILTTEMVESVTANARKHLDALKAAYPRVKIETLLIDGDIRYEILGVADRVEAELLVLGTHGRRGVRRALLGSVSESVVRLARCPVLVVR